MDLIFSPLFFSPPGLAPQISVTMLASIRMAYGCLLLLHLLIALPNWKRFFMGEKWGGYAKSSAFDDVLQSPSAAVTIGIIWLGCAFALISNYQPLIAAIINLVICRYYFVEMRWRGVARGMGAPGFMTYWLAFATVLLQCALDFAPAQLSLVLLVVQVDFALIMLSAGLYKLSAGYAANEGMEYGLVNPEWGYWWKLYKKLNPANRVFKLMNHLAWLTEVVSAILMLVPTTRFLGALLMLLSFVFIRTQIRLGALCEMVMVGCLFFFHPGSAVDVLNSELLKWLQVSPALINSGVPLIQPQDGLAATLLQIGLWTYLILLPLSHAGLYFNFYKKKRLPEPLQVFLEKYTNTFGIIIWRVFSVDVVNFFIMIYEKNKATGEKRLLSTYGWPLWSRFSHVGECICITSLFTTLKYYCSNKDLFEERILRYSRTLPCAEGSVIEFEYSRVIKDKGTFVFKPIAFYTVDLAPDGSGTVVETIEDESYSTTAAHVSSPVHEGATPGSYAPAKK